VKAGHFPSRYPVRSVRDQLIAGRARAQSSSSSSSCRARMPTCAMRACSSRLRKFGVALVVARPPPLNNTTRERSWFHAATSDRLADDLPATEITPKLADRVAADALHAIETNLMAPAARSLRCFAPQACHERRQRLRARLLSAPLPRPPSPAEPAPTLTARSAYFVHAGRGEREREAAVRVERLRLEQLARRGDPYAARRPH
jgi:hypothetical protein